MSLSAISASLPPSYPSPASGTGGRGAERAGNAANGSRTNTDTDARSTASSEETQRGGQRRGEATNRQDKVATAAEEREITLLQQRDREVRAHEMAHVAAAAGLVVRGASYSYETGPDGKRYAVGGEVQIDTSPGRTPQETLDKAQRIRTAALAPADPSPQDHAVAAKASQMAMQARTELAAEAAQAARNGGKARDDDGTGGSAPRPLPAYSASVLLPSEAGSRIDLYA